MDETSCSFVAMRRLFIFMAIGIVMFAICYFLVYRVGAQFIKTVPSTEPVINRGVLMISILMTVVALQRISSLFGPSRNRR